MIRTMLKSKIHRATVTEACLDYEGSITIDSTLLEAANIMEYEQVDVYNVSNGERFSTYAIKGETQSGTICVNGAAARKCAAKDLIIICTYVGVEEAQCNGHKPINVYVDASNKIAKMG